MRKAMPATVMGLLAAAALTLAACGKQGKAVSEESPAAQSEAGRIRVTFPKNQMRMQTEQGDLVEIINSGDDLRIPDDFPNDVYIFPGSKVLNLSRSPQATQVTLQVLDTIDHVTATYETQLEQSGWNPRPATILKVTRYLEYAKDQRSLMVYVFRGKNEVQVVLMVVKSEGVTD